MASRLHADTLATGLKAMAEPRVMRHCVGPRPAKRGKGNKASTADATDDPIAAERRAAMSLQRSA